MNKQLILVFSALAASVVIVLSIWGLLQPSNSVRLSLPDGVDYAVIDGVERSDGQRFGIKPGEYSYRLIGDNIDNSQYDITITEDMEQLEVTYAPYARHHLDRLAVDQSEAIRSIVNQQYVNRVDGYHIHKVSLLDRGQYAVALITPVGIDTDNPVNVYRVLLGRSGDSWSISTGPELLLTTANSPSIDKYILQSANNLAL